MESHDAITKKAYEPNLAGNCAGGGLKKRGTLTLPDASAIGCSARINDEMSYVVELNTNGTYRTYVYDNPNAAKCNEAKRMIGIGNIISEEFGVLEMSTKP
jgi:hypothetical protein